ASAEALLPRLPLRMRWRMRLEQGRLHWHAAVECERTVGVRLLIAQIPLPAAYTRWWYGARAGRFPDILPSHHATTPVVPEEAGCTQGAFAPEDADLPPATLRFVPQHPFTGMQYDNGSYAAGNRTAAIVAHFPEGHALQAGQLFELGEIVLDLSHDNATFAAWRAAAADRHTITAGPLRARMRPGQIELFWQDTPVSAAVHLHTQIRAEDLWIMSQGLQWE